MTINKIQTKTMLSKDKQKVLLVLTASDLHIHLKAMILNENAIPSEMGEILWCVNINRVRERQSGKEEEKGVKERDGALGKDQSLVPGEQRQMK